MLRLPRRDCACSLLLLVWVSAAEIWCGQLCMCHLFCTYLIVWSVCARVQYLVLCVEYFSTWQASGQPTQDDLSYCCWKEADSAPVPLEPVFLPWFIPSPFLPLWRSCPCDVSSSSPLFSCVLQPPPFLQLVLHSDLGSLESLLTASVLLRDYLALCSWLQSLANSASTHLFNYPSYMLPPAFWFVLFCPRDTCASFQLRLSHL